MKKYITYKSLSKEERKKAINKFDKSKIGESSNKIYFRLIVESIISFATAIALTVYALIEKESWTYYAISACLAAFGLFLIIGEKILKRKNIEKMLNQ